jgi:hydroxymethylpyrimidine pyrophosphatase-like HAD family hydrolase
MATQMLFATAQKKRKTIVVDFDGTIAEDKFPDIGKPMPGVKPALQRLIDAGYEIVVFTCRMACDKGHTRAEANEQKQDITEWLDKNEIPYTKIEDGFNGKPRALFYVDNKNLEYHGGSDWEHLSSFILSQG